MIGILAGMGPRSTGPFIDQVVTAFQSLMGAKYDIDFPPMMIYSLPTPFYVDRPIDDKLMKKTICEGLKKLEACGVTFIAMPCNTAHLYFTDLQDCIKVPLLNIVNATLARVPRSTKKITILATRPTLESRIYQKDLEDSHLPYAFDQSWQKKIDDMIFNIKTSANYEEAILIWKELSNNFCEVGIDTIILACTDLNVIFKSIHAPFHIIDSSLCLAETIVKKWKEQL